MSNLSLKAAENLQQIRETKPLIHNITNFVVMNYTANVLLSMGAYPVMAHAENEVKDMVEFAGALVDFEKQLLEMGPLRLKSGKE